MLLTIFACLDRRPMLAGILIGLLTIKAAARPAVAGDARGFRPLARFSGGKRDGRSDCRHDGRGVFGPQVWIDFVQKGLPVQNLVLADPARIGTPFFPTIFMNVRGAGASYAIAMTVQACFSAFAIGAVFFAFRFRRDADPRFWTALFLPARSAPFLIFCPTIPCQ